MDVVCIVAFLRLLVHSLSNAALPGYFWWCDCLGLSHVLKTADACFPSILGVFWPSSKSIQWYTISGTPLNCNFHICIGNLNWEQPNDPRRMLAWHSRIYRKFRVAIHLGLQMKPCRTATSCAAAQIESNSLYSISRLVKPEKGLFSILSFLPCEILYVGLVEEDVLDLPYDN